MAAIAVLLLNGIAASAEEKPAGHGKQLEDFVHGAPANPSKAWSLAAGGRLYDNWWDALDKKKPAGAHPSYPATGTRSGPGTWRCVECHGWDYKGKDGVYGQGAPMGDRYTGIKGITAASKLGAAGVMKLLRAPLHGYTAEMIPDASLQRLAMFVVEGLHDADQAIDRKTGKARGNKARGAAIFETMCAACHGFDGRTLNWGTAAAPAFVGTEANKFPWEVLHKMQNSHPGAAMINLRALPFEDAKAVLAYTQTLPVK